MKKILFLIFIALCYMSCAEKDSWSASPSLHLTFSRDTVAFDTLISTVPSSTKTLTVFNQNKNGLRISRISLGKGADSPFRANVDGEFLYNGQGADFQIYAKDSLMVRLEVTPPQVGSSDTLSFKDYLEFHLESGVVQRVCLTAGALDAYFVHGLVLRNDTTITSEKPFIVFDSLVVMPEVTLTLEPGTRLMFHDKAGLILHGNLQAIGTQDRPVVFRGDRTDRMFDNLPYDNTPSRWEGIRICESSKENIFVHCDIHSGCYGIVCDSTSDLSTPTLYMENSVIHNIGGDGLQLNHVSAQFLNTQISNTLGTSVYIHGGHYLFLHCTIAQFYPFVAERGDALYMANEVNGVYRDLHRCHFINSVITGYGEDVIMGSISEGQDYQCDYLFQNCFLNTIASTDSTRFVGIVYDTDELETPHEKNFLRFDTDNFLYDFTPDSISPIRNIGTTDFLEALPSDRFGRSRQADGKPDAGCYEYIVP